MWRVVNARKNHPSHLISPGPTQGLARYILETRNIMYTTKLAYTRHLHRNHLCLCVELSQGVKLPSWYPYLLISHGLALGLVHYRERGVFFYTHYSLCKSREALFFHFREKLCQKLKVMRLRMDRQGFNTFYYTIESFQKFRATALLYTLWVGWVDEISIPPLQNAMWTDIQQGNLLG